MNKILAKIERQNHLNHLISVMPLITTVFGIQCFIMWKFSTEIDIGNYAITMGLFLSTFIGMMVYYDNNHHVVLYKDHLHIQFGLTGTNKKIPLMDITEIITAEDETKFSSMIIRTKDKGNHVLYFIDFPLQVKLLIDSQIKELRQEALKDFDQAA